METNNLDIIALHETLKHSMVFGDQYRERFEDNIKSTFNAPVYLEVEQLLNHILGSYPSLTEFQINILYKLFNALNDVKAKIDPDRLKPFKDFLNADDELLLFRQSDHGLINIIINPEDCIAYSLLSANKDKRVLEFYDEDGDFEGLVYKFFSY